MQMRHLYHGQKRKYNHAHDSQKRPGKYACAASRAEVWSATGQKIGP